MRAHVFAEYNSVFVGVGVSVHSFHVGLTVFLTILAEVRTKHTLTVLSRPFVVQAPQFKPSGNERSFYQKLRHIAVEETLKPILLRL